jgi:hypothetical protein
VDVNGRPGASVYDCAPEADKVTDLRGQTAEEERFTDKFGAGNTYKGIASVALQPAVLVPDTTTVKDWGGLKNNVLPVVPVDHENEFAPDAIRFTGSPGQVEFEDTAMLILGGDWILTCTVFVEMQVVLPAEPVTV